MFAPATAQAVEIHKPLQVSDKPKIRLAFSVLNNQPLTGMLRAPLP
jgi:hypothetical protein